MKKLIVFSLLFLSAQIFSVKNKKINRDLNYTLIDQVEENFFNLEEEDFEPLAGVLNNCCFNTCLPKTTEVTAKACFFTFSSMYNLSKMITYCGGNCLKPYLDQGQKKLKTKQEKLKQD